LGVKGPATLGLLIGGEGAGRGSSNDLLGVRGGVAGVGPNGSEICIGECLSGIKADVDSCRGLGGNGGAFSFLASKPERPFNFDKDNTLFSWSFFFGDGGGPIDRSASPDFLSIVDVRGDGLTEGFLDGTREEPRDDEL
jgi:hypothetical protein